MSYKTKSERETLFISLLNGTDEELTDLAKTLEQAGITDDYRVIASARPLQALDEHEAAELMKQWQGVKIQSQEQQQFSEQTLYRLQNTLSEMTKMLGYLKGIVQIGEENFLHLENFSHDVVTAIKQIQTDTKVPISLPNEFCRLMSRDSPKLGVTHHNIQSLAPREGEEFF